MKELLTPTEAAKIIGCQPNLVRARMLYGEWDIGQVIRPNRKNERKNCRYEISRAKLCRMLGIIQEGLQEEGLVESL